MSNLLTHVKQKKKVPSKTHFTKIKEAEKSEKQTFFSGAIIIKEVMEKNLITIMMSLE